jgi:hypothetical protein
MTCDTAGWETRSCAAALLRLPDCTTAKNTRRSRSRNRRPMWSSQSAIFATSVRFHRRNQIEATGYSGDRLWLQSCFIGTAR